MKTRHSKKQKAWRLLRILRLGTNADLTAQHPKVIQAAKTVGVGRAIKFITNQNTSTDLMAKGKRQLGSFHSKT